MIQTMQFSKHSKGFANVLGGRKCIQCVSKALKIPELNFGEKLECKESLK